MPRGKAKPKIITFPNSIIHRQAIAMYVLIMCGTDPEWVQRDFYYYLRIAGEMPPEKLKKALNDRGVYYHKGFWGRRSANSHTPTESASVVQSNHHRRG